MDANSIRTVSKEIARKAGLVIPDHLPLLEEGLKLRHQNDAVNRLLCLNAVGAVSYGFDRAKAFAWLQHEKLDGLLTEQEILFVQRGAVPPQIFRVQIEGLWALAWALHLVVSLDFWRDCDSRFATMLPNLKAGQRGDEWRSMSRLRSIDEVVAACDLAYCLHWAIRQAEIDGEPAAAGPKPYVVVERRRALEWLLSDESWDRVSLDT